MDKSQAISFFATMESNLALSLGTQRLVAMLTGLFAALALVLSLTGLYAVLAYLVSQRTPEIGIRMALGATRRQVVGLVMRSGLVLVGIGLGARHRRRRGGEPSDPPATVRRRAAERLVYAAVAALFAIVAALACLGPSLRASRIDPLVAFRSE